jgi:hypothetical protein
LVNTAYVTSKNIDSIKIIDIPIDDGGKHGLLSQRKFDIASVQVSLPDPRQTHNIRRANKILRNSRKFKHFGGTIT